MHISQYEDLCEVATETATTVLSGSAAVLAKKTNIKISVIIKQQLFPRRYQIGENHLILRHRGKLINLTIRYP